MTQLVNLMTETNCSPGTSCPQPQHPSSLTRRHTPLIASKRCWWSSAQTQTKSPLLWFLLRWGISSAASGRSRRRLCRRRGSASPTTAQSVRFKTKLLKWVFQILPVVSSVFMTNRAFCCLFWEVCSLKGLLEPGTVDRLGFWTGTRIRDEQWDRWVPHLEQLHGSPENPVRNKQTLIMLLNFRIGWNSLRWRPEQTWKSRFNSFNISILYSCVTWGKWSSWE